MTTTPLGFVKHLTESGFNRHRPIERIDGFSCARIDMTSIRLRVGHFVPFLVSDGSTGDAPSALVPAAALVARRMSDHFVVLPLGTSLGDEAERLLEIATNAKLVILEPADVDAIVAAPRGAAKTHAMAGALVRRMGRTALSPYELGPATGSQFFGRSALLKRIAITGRTGPSYCIMGNRRIGKTSLMHEIARRVRLSNETAQAGHVYLSSARSTADVIHLLLQSISTRHAHRLLDRPDLTYQFPHLLRDIAAQGPIYFFGDEADKLVAFDEHQGFECLDLLRAAAQQGVCRFFFAGFRRLITAMEDVNTPLFNFATAIKVTGLSRDDTREMVERPLVALGINVAGTGLADTIYRETGGYPELIQMFCQEIIELFSESNSIPGEAQLLEYVFANDDFYSRVFGTFLGSANAIEQLAAYLLAKQASQSQSGIDTFEFTVEDVKTALKERGVSLDFPMSMSLVRHVKVSGIISQVKGTQRFRFSVPQLARYCTHLDLESMIDDCLGRIDDGEVLAALQSENAASERA